ncbi:MAG TPA: UvrD-helicase domain-containing protein [Candidatus Polarisedimenticolia bacterium]|nr:UvrD-helicase domain-containing protein [Candidatus Polarisedimenticolia bacterium]
MDSLLEPLNPPQREAVLQTEGPLLVVAGAGSGKTRVIVHRLAHILARGLAPPQEVLAVTFTNKAAGEMKERVDRLVGADHGGAQVSTFHSWCLRLLRRHAGRIGYGSGFLVYDDSDQTALLKECLADLQIDDRAFPPRLFRHRISDAKNRGLAPEDLARARESFQDEMTAKVFASYQEALRRSNAMDFDDLIGQALRLLGSETDLARDVASRVRYLMVDEYQDTNPPQYRLIRELGKVHGNVCAVGDPDQSIYRFRFADIRNILSFEEDFPGTRTIKLEQNYRSTGSILEAATAVVRHNRSRIDKTLWCDAPRGEPIEILTASDERHEAERVVQRIRDQTRQGVGLEEVAILYRTNAQSRSFEEALTRAAMPYIVVGGTRFYDRREIKDVIAYVRLLLNPRDDVSLRRIVNVPPRDIGRATLDTLLDLARRDASSLEEAIRKTVDLALVPGRAGKALRGFLDLLADLRRAAGDVTPSRLLKAIIDRTGFQSYLQAGAEGDAAARLENLEQLVSAIADYDGMEGGLQAFLDRTALLSETENQQGTSGARLMTLHSAKGLEFPVVFIVGLEEDLFPHSRSAEEHDDIEEERRLLYVGMTRARRRLILSRALTRRLFGEPRPVEPSRFLQEIPAALVREPVADNAYAGRLLAVAARLAGRAGSEGPRRGARDSYDETQVAFDPDDSGRGLPAPYSLGCKVHHPEYGVGTVIGVEGSGEKLKLTVSFSIHGSKKFLPRFARLERI